MDSKRNNFVRFQSWSSEKSSSFEHQHSMNDRKYSRNSSRATFDRFFESFWRGFGRGSETNKSLKNNQISIPSHVDGQPRKDHSGPKKTKILDPQDQFLQTWNKIFVLSCVISVALDPLFFYTPVLKVNGKKKCLSFEWDKTLAIIASVLRSVTDAFYAIHIYFQFRTGIIPPSRVFGRGELIDDPMAIAKRYLSTYFIIDILAILPCPQVVVFLAPKRGVLSLKEMLKAVIFSQYVPRLLRIYPLYVEVTRTSGILTETAWAGAAYNLFLYMLASHVVGAFWYLFGIERQVACWRKMCKNITSCLHHGFYCTAYNLSERHGDLDKISQFCRIVEPDDQKENSTNDPFDYGIFTKVLKSGVVESKYFLDKLSYCFWWGLRSLSSLGQNLDTSTYFWEIVFAVSIAIAGLVLFSLLIGNMQKYLQSTTVRVEEMRVRKTDAEQWMSQRMLPTELRERVRRYEQYKWLETRGVEEENLIRNLPKDLRRDIKRHLCLDLLMKVPMFRKMDQQLWDPLVDRLKPVLYTQNSYIVREGDPVDEMLFIMRGNLATFTTNGGITGFFNTADLGAGDFCGEELLTWALYAQSSTTFPLSTRTVVAKAEVQAFALMAEDLKTVASQFRKLHSKELQHTFKCYSQQWRTWAACFIQSAWHRYSKKNHERALRDAENRLQFALANEAGISASLGATIYASMFAARLLRALRRPKGGRSSTRAPQRVLQLLPPKPTVPDFSVEGY
ncbi:cyclic nucleotide-gated ion channel 1-like [Juglans microcarpa x Juglans regia]|uniref:cyclic nucleotide-gated ion channel 1-like n=1 Tax=Juglans microcarpa x Juglans regia TaxID=2249226 RepID=UPI001B7E5FDA|nr:cyclic nucleotide-gated ion channel 1-like [Juglans microcarpa x Juglans regia]XP_040988360.1 cyclic nucleotide-gated ion channel 1-like [Juglans microcarpa x Juglans regia]XP_040988365.1 cyclic nucleotide-gated ion channel 1-like [Juglans microcarpa x Juglans regia]